MDKPILWCSMVIVIALALSQSAIAQQGTARPFGGGTNVGTLIRNEKFLAIIEATVEQKGALERIAEEYFPPRTPGTGGFTRMTPETQKEMWGKIDEALKADAAKLQKFQEIYFQMATVPTMIPGGVDGSPATGGLNSVTLDGWILATLDLTAEQQEKIAAIVATRGAELRQQSGGGMTMEERTPIFTKYGDQIRSLLTIDQRVKAGMLAATAVEMRTKLGIEQPLGWKLVWEENFDKEDVIDPAVWSKIPRGSSDWNRHMSSHGPLYDVKEGKLILRGKVNPGLPGDDAPFITGGIFSKDKKGFHRGRLEISAKFGDARGAWPAIWLLPFNNERWPDGGELDIVERLHDEPIAHQNVHSYFTNRLRKREPRTNATTPIRNGEFNTYGVELHPDRVVFLVNGSAVHVYPRIDAPAEEKQFPFDKPFYLLMDMQLGGAWTGEPNPAHLPVEMHIDWVRFYEWQ